MASHQVERRQIYGATISRLQSGETKQHWPRYFQTSKINTIKIASECIVAARGISAKRISADRTAIMAVVREQPLLVGGGGDGCG